jgi:hypothetical protein
MRGSFLNMSKSKFMVLVMVEKYISLPYNVSPMNGRCFLQTSLSCDRGIMLTALTK